jgi:mRNA-degrading endonuclease toxin of MazEF toxin-antitoxin module
MWSMTSIHAAEMTRRTEKGAKAKTQSQERPKTPISPDQAARAPSQTHATFGALVTLVASGLRAVTLKPNQPTPADAQTAQPEAPLAPSQEAPRVERQSASDFAGADTVTAVTPRAGNEMAVNHPGFLASIAAESARHDGLRADDSEGRMLCRQLDAATWLMEGLSPLARRQADVASNDDFTDERFLERGLA